MHCVACCCCILLDPLQDLNLFSKVSKVDTRNPKLLHILLEFQVALACPAGDSQLLLLTRTP